MYDPLGILAAVTLSAKIIQQGPCRKVWMEWCNAPEYLISAETVVGWHWVTVFISRARCIKPKDFGALIHSQLHHFADASNDDYVAVSCIWLQNWKKNVQVVFLFNKTRVLLLKSVTIPWLRSNSCCPGFQSGCDIEVRAPTSVWQVCALDWCYISFEVLLMRTIFFKLFWQIGSLPL